jgi:selenoprotein W-related protein
MAVGLAAELLTSFKRNVRALTLVPGDGGCFEVKVNGKLVFSKLQVHRFPEAGEVMTAIRQVVPANAKA